MTAPTRDNETEFEPVYHRYGPHRAGLPPLVPYFRELWHRREFAAEMSRATMRSANVSTFFGQAWLVLNPLLTAAVYYLLVTIIRGRHDPAFFTHLTLGLFAFNLVSTSITSGATSVTTSGRLLINTAFPRLLIPLSAVRTAFFRFLPTIPVYLFFHVLFLRDQWSWQMLLGGYFLVTMILFGMGMAAFFSTLQIYFRDTSSFLPFFVRLWMYLSPVLWLPEAIFNSDFPRWMLTLIQINPMYSMLGGYSDAIQEGRVPDLSMWVTSAVWAVAVAVLGFLFFISREREFAVRLT
ncbi:teichoic acid transport system permease protein [Friedmanniella luteola]|uniref:Teichoic acid transport system permease protein n=1 Tax=Friedmanniella luteola TaxID=546871 RepID=A0A1H2ABN6_9ACTN|nr:ABC transporter permease [Friedmanniella luteola]SDT43381.1 teichoic acid transport system permease protein [Friedmanniella luteola]